MGTPAKALAVVIASECSKKSDSSAKPMTNSTAATPQTMPKAIAKSFMAGTAIRQSARKFYFKATPLSSQATASPSMMQEREQRRANVSRLAVDRENVHF